MGTNNIITTNQNTV